MKEIILIALFFSAIGLGIYWGEHMPTNSATADISAAAGNTAIVDDSAYPSARSHFRHSIKKSPENFNLVENQNKQIVAVAASAATATISAPPSAPFTPILNEISISLIDSATSATIASTSSISAPVSTFATPGNIIINSTVTSSSISTSIPTSSVAASTSVVASVSAMAPTSTSKSSSKKSAPAHIAAPSPRSGKIIISQIMIGKNGNRDYQFIELYNPNVFAIDLTGWSVAKKSSRRESRTKSGIVTESILVSKKYFKNKKILPGKYLLLAKSGGYDGQPAADILWPKSHSLAQTNNAVILYDTLKNKIQEINWQKFPKNQAMKRTPLNSDKFVSSFHPAPKNSQSP